MRRIAMVGTSGSGNLAPFGNPDFEIWGVSSRLPHVTRATRWFELHRLEGEPQDWAAAYRERFKQFSQDIGEVLMFWPEPDLAPNVTRYPVERISQRFGTFFMTSSFSWMMALAIDEMCPIGEPWQPGEISISGVEMEYGTEYRQQRAGLRHFMRLAEFAGIKVSLLVSGGLSYEPVPYPMWQDDPLLNKLEQRRAKTRADLAAINDSLHTTQTMVSANRGALNEIGVMQTSENYDAAAREKIFQRELDNLTSMSGKLSKDLVYAQGCASEQDWTFDYLQP